MGKRGLNLIIAFFMLFTSVSPSWGEIPASLDKLSPEIISQSSLMNMSGETFKDSIFNDYKLLTSLIDIADYLCNDKLPFEFLESNMLSRIRKVWGDGYVSPIRFSRIVPFCTIKERVGTINANDLPDVMPEEDIIVVPYFNESTRVESVIYIADTSKVPKKHYKGFDWQLSDRYVAKVEVDHPERSYSEKHIEPLYDDEVVAEKSVPKAPGGLLHIQSEKGKSEMKELVTDRTLPLIDLDESEVIDTALVDKWRQELSLEEGYAEIEDSLEYSIPHEVAKDEEGSEVFIPGKGRNTNGVSIYKHELPGAFGNGVHARAVHIENRPREQYEYSSNIANFLCNGQVFNMSPRLAPYSNGHIIVGNYDLPQELDKEGYALKVFLLLNRILGEGYEGFINVIAPTVNTLHAQYVKNRLTIWDVEDISKWPMKAELVEGEDIGNVTKRAMRIYNRYKSETPGMESDSDIMMSYREGKNGRGTYRVIIIPRLKDLLKPREKEFKSDKDWGTMGGLEVGGCFMAADKTKKAYNMLLENNGALYKNAMENISWTGRYTLEKYDALVRDVFGSGTSNSWGSSYEVRSFSPEEALTLLVYYLSEVGDEKDKYKDYISKLSGVSQDEFETIANEAIEVMRIFFNSLKRDNFFVITEFMPEGVYNAYSTLFRYLRKDFKTVMGELGTWKEITSANNFINRHIFADGEGDVRFDNYGFRGKWEVSTEDVPDIPNRLVLRTVDALSISVSERDDSCYPEMEIRIIKKIPDREITDGILMAGTQDAVILYDSNKNILLIERAICDMPRDIQTGIFAQIEFPLDVPGHQEAPQKMKIKAGTKKRSDAIVIPLAMVETGRARDYLHHKFSYRVEAYFSNPVIIKPRYMRV